jgi:hypothetical protein
VTRKSTIIAIWTTLVLLFAGSNCFAMCAACTDSRAVDDSGAVDSAPCHGHKMPGKSGCPYRLVVAERTQAAVHTHHVSTHLLHIPESAVYTLANFQLPLKLAAFGAAPPRSSPLSAVLRI